MDQHNPMNDTVAGLAPSWEETAAERVELFAANLGSRAQGEAMRITHPGEGADMNAALVHAIRQATLQGVQIDLAYLANDVRKLADQDADARNRASQQAAQNAYNQGLVEGVEKGKSYQQRDQADAADRLAYGNPSAYREGEDMIIPKGYVAAWFHVHEEPDGTKFHREVYGTLDADVRDGDTRAVIVAGPDKHLISLDRVRFAPNLHTLVAERDLKRLPSLEFTATDPSAVRVTDGMDGEGRISLNVHTLEPENAVSTAKPGTYIRLGVHQDGVAKGLLDLTREQWLDLQEAAETLYARHLINQSAGDES
jgi:hypothetical protein